MTKKFKFALRAAMLLFACVALGACSSDGPDPDPDPDPEPTVKNYHFDLWVALDRHGGMGRDVQTLVSTLTSLDADQPMISFEGTGVEVNSIMTLESIVDGPYYIQVPVSGDRFSKYTIENNHINVVRERQFGTNTFSPRKYTHAWTGDDELVIIAANGPADKVIWTKLNTADMSIVSEGSFNLPLLEGSKVFTASGIAKYRPQDNKIFYFYTCKTSSGRKGVRVGRFHVAVIDASTMALEKIYDNGIADEMVGTAYGELLQPSCFVDNNGDLYIAAMNEGANNAAEQSFLLKIPAGQTTFDASYNGFNLDKHKLCAIIPLNDGKALAYVRDDVVSTDIDGYSHYYVDINLRNGTHENIKYNGTDLPLSGGRFSCRMAARDGVAYIGVNPEQSNPVIYIYNTADGSVVKGAEMKEGYYFEQIRIVDNLPQ